MHTDPLPHQPVDTTPTPGISRTSYDVVVVGARAAGAATAMLLARRGLNVLAVDRSASSETDVLSTHSLARAGVIQLQRWGLLDRVRAAGTPVARTVEFHYGGEPFRIDVSAGAPVDGLYSPRRTVLDPILASEAQRNGAEVVFGARVTGLEVGGDGGVTGLELVVGGRRRRVGAGWVVGADGTRSVIARTLQVPAIRTERVTSAILYGYWSGLADHTIVNHYDLPGLVVGVIPTNAGEACVWVAIPPQRFAAECRGDIAAAYLRLLGEHPGLAGDLASATFASGVRAFPGMNGYLRSAHGPGWALVGDAGYFKDPVSAHGLTDAFVSAELLSDAIVDALGGVADRHQALAAYQSRRDELADLLMPPVARLATLELTGDQAGAAFREMGAALRREIEMVVGFDAPPLALV